MPIDPSKALGATLKAAEASWNEDRLILYALGVGIGLKESPVDPKVLQYTYENFADGFKALPTYAVIPVFSSLMDLMSVPGLDFNPMMLLHGEQYTEILKPPLPTTATVVNDAKLSAIYDKGPGKGAVIVLDIVSKDKASGTPLFKNEFTVFIRGEGGFGKESDPKQPAPGNEPPPRDPDVVIEYPTAPNQALLYRLSGDKNPLHADPNMAAIGGFDRPILHGLCTFGNVGRAAIEAFAPGKPENFRSIKVRFAKPVFPGETIQVKMWKESPTDVICEAFVKERDVKVISNARVTFFA